LSGTLSARQQCKCELDIQYGDGQRAYDIYYPQTVNDDTPVFVYVHGGYWQELSKDHGAFMAQTFTEAGCIVIALGYPIAPGPTIEEITEAARLAIIDICQRFKKRRIYVSGHSAGAHLCAMVLSSDLATHDFQPRCEGAFLLTGVYDLVPLVKTYINAPLHMTEDSAQLCSPQQHAASFQKDCHVVVAVGEYDSPAFKQQAHTYVEALRSSGVASVSLLEIQEVDHFNLVEKLSDPQYKLTQVILSAMGVSPKI
jgi:arylformamidase